MQSINRFPRWLLVVFALAMCGLMAGGALFYRIQGLQERQEIEAEVETIASLKTNQIVQWRSERLGDAAVISESPFFSDAIARWLKEPSAELTRQILLRFESLREHYHYFDVLMVDARVQTRLSSSGRLGALHPDAVDAFTAAMETHAPVLTDLHLGPDDLPPHVDVIAPLYGGGDSRTEPLGAILLQTDAQQFLYPLIQSWPTPSQTAETLLVERDGDSVLFLNELRHLKGTALLLRIPLSQTEVPAVQAVLGATGIVRGTDYRGTDVIAAVKAIPDSPWFIVAKEDTSEVLRGWRRESILIVASMLGIALASILAVAVIWQSSQKAHFKSIWESEERYGATLRSIGDGVIAIDSEGRVELMNPVAEQLTGWRLEEALGKPLGEVFRLINEETRLPSENPAERVLREGRIVSLANHMVLVAKDGSEWPVADSGAPIRNEEGVITGVVLVFRDQTAERTARKKILRLSAIVESSNDAIVSQALDGEITFWNKAAEEMFGYAAQEVAGKSVAILAPPTHARESEQILEKIARAEIVQHLETLRARKDGSLIHVAITVSPIFDSEGRLTGASTIARDVSQRIRMEAEKERLQDQLLQAQKMESVGRLAGGVAHYFNNMLQVILGNAEISLAGVDPGHGLSKSLKQIRDAARRSADLTRHLLAFARKQTVIPEVMDLNGTMTGMLAMLQGLIGENIELAWKPGARLWRVKVDPAQVDQILVNLVVNARDAISGAGRILIETRNETIDGEFCAVHAGFTPGEYAALSVADNGSGMDKETLAHLFEPFFTTKGMGKGTGLGLASVYGSVMQNRGSIYVESEPRRGSTFTIYLPRFPD